MDFAIDNDTVQKFKENGFVVIPGFLSATEVQRLKDATKQLVEKYCQDAPVSIFRLAEGSYVSDQSKYNRETYFAESGDKIRGFFEEQAVDADGKIVVPDVARALNKIGHALHKYDPDFHSVTFSSKNKTVLRNLTNMKKPTVIQSMVIFKHPKIGGIVLPHQDATFMYTEPVKGNLIGFWIALDDATLENGCIHFLPGSHKEGKLYHRYVQNPDKDSQQLFIIRGEKVPHPPKEKLIAAPAKPGDLVLIDGLVIHQSEPNTSSKPRLAYTFHVVEGDAEYAPENWLQPTEAKTFMEM